MLSHPRSAHGFCGGACGQKTKLCTFTRAVCCEFGGVEGEDILVLKALWLEGLAESLRLVPSPTCLARLLHTAVLFSPLIIKYATHSNYLTELCLYSPTEAYTYTRN